MRLRMAVAAVLAFGAPAFTEAQTATLWGALAFTADGSYSRAWGQKSKAEAEAAVLRNCAKFGRGACEVISFSGRLCGALASYRRKPNAPDHKISYTSGGDTLAEARRKAVDRCDADQRTAKSCRIRTAVCADGRK
jgi:hypothetical protein